MIHSEHASRMGDGLDCNTRFSCLINFTCSIRVPISQLLATLSYTFISFDYLKKIAFEKKHSATAKMTSWNAKKKKKRRKTTCIYSNLAIVI